MQLCIDIGGFSTKEANIVRKSLIKKSDATSLCSYKQRFIVNASKEIGEKEAERLWDEMERMSEYAFCRAHAVCYSMIACFDLWLKYYYGFEFYTSVLNNLGEKNTDKISEIIGNIYGKELLLHIDNKPIPYSVIVLPPDVNNPSEQFALDDKYHIRYGLKYIKGIVSKDLQDLIKNNSKFDNAEQFILYAVEKRFNKATIYSLIFCGACDVFDQSRNSMWDYYLDLTGIKDKKNFTIDELLAMERDLIGINFDIINRVENVQSANTLKDVSDSNEGNFEIVFSVKDILTKKTKTGKPYKIIIINNGLFNIFVWDVDRFKQDGIKIGDIVKCVVCKRNGFVQYISSVHNGEVGDEISKQKKFSSSSNKNSLIKQMDLEI